MSTLTAALFLRQSKGRNVWASVCCVALHVQFTLIYVAEVFKGNYFAKPVTNIDLGPAAARPVLRGLPRRGWP